MLEDTNEPEVAHIATTEVRRALRCANFVGAAFISLVLPFCFLIY